jgi:hypothetical protein
LTVLIGFVSFDAVVGIVSLAQRLPVFLLCGRLPEMSPAGGKTPRPAARTMKRDRAGRLQLRPEHRARCR